MPGVRPNTAMIERPRFPARSLFADLRIHTYLRPVKRKWWLDVRHW